MSGARAETIQPARRPQPARWIAGIAATLTSDARAQRHSEGAQSDEPEAIKFQGERESCAQRPSPHAPREDEFDAFFARHELPLTGYLRRMLPADESALEIAQEAFFRAWKHFDEIRTYDRPEAWLYRVATNLAISHLRRRRPLNFAQLFRRTTADVESGETLTEAEFLADPLDVEVQTAQRDLIDRVLRRLPERQRAALLLRVVHGQSCEEIAHALNISLPNARQTLSRGRERFRKLYVEANGKA